MAYTLAQGSRLGDTLLALTNLHPVAAHNANAKAIVDELSSILDEPSVEARYKCHQRPCVASERKTDATTEKKNCNELDRNTVKITIPKESGSFTLSFALDAASGAMFLISGGIAKGGSVAGRVAVTYTVALVKYTLLYRTHCVPPKCEDDTGEIAIKLHCTLGIMAEVDATIDLGFGVKISASSVTGKSIVTDKWDRELVVDVPFHC